MTRASTPKSRKGLRLLAPVLSSSTIGAPFQRNKYGAKSVRTEDGYFASQAEYRRWLILRMLEKSGKIQGLLRQQTYALNVNGHTVCKYIADATYTADGVFVVEDCKGFKTPEYLIKAKLFHAIHGYPITETR